MTDDPKSCYTCVYCDSSDDETCRRTPTATAWLDDAFGAAHPIDPSCHTPDVPLKPCPFCGATDLAREFDSETDYWTVFCCHCGAMMPHADAAEAVRRWNRRPA